MAEVEYGDSALTIEYRLSRIPDLQRMILQQPFAPTAFGREAS